MRPLLRVVAATLVMHHNSVVRALGSGHALVEKMVDTAQKAQLCDVLAATNSEP